VSILNRQSQAKVANSPSRLRTLRTADADSVNFKASGTHTALGWIQPVPSRRAATTDETRRRKNHNESMGLGTQWNMAEAHGRVVRLARC
jgi:hypothetical protein